jgi:hypothetical protein
MTFHVASNELAAVDTTPSTVAHVKAAECDFWDYAAVEGDTRSTPT